MTKTRILFSNPPWWEGTAAEMRGGIRAGSRWPFTHRLSSRPDKFAMGEYLPYPFFMGYAASWAQREFPEAEVELRDSIALRESYGSFIDHLTTTRPDYIVIETATPSWDHDAAVIQQVADLGLGAQVIVTGPITSARAGDVLALPNVVAAVKGEYEKGVARAIRGTRGVIEHDLLTVEEMNSAPFPLFPANVARRYWDACPKGQRMPQAQVWSSRGCPFKCIFCVWPAVMTGNDPDGTAPRRVRHYSADYMRAFLTELIDKYNYRCIYFDDDTFNLGDKHVLAMCEVMRFIGLPWSAMCRADTIKRETWQAMKDAGCFGVKIGFESGNQYVIDHIVNKRLDLKAAADTVRFLKSIGLTVHGTFTVGLPGETSVQMADTVRFIRSLPLDSHQLSGTAEIEGTPLATLTERGHLDAYDGASLEGYVREADGQKKIENFSANP